MYNDLREPFHDILSESDLWIEYFRPCKLADFGGTPIPELELSRAFLDCVRISQCMGFSLKGLMPAGFHTAIFFLGELCEL